MTDFQYDLFVIGAGSAGVRAARTAAKLGARVAIAEHQALGGTCVNLGCVPKKLFVYASQYAQQPSEAAAYGLTLGPMQFDWARLRDNKTREIQRLNQVYHDLLINSGVHCINGQARLVDGHCVQVGQQRYTSQFILIATGAQPVAADIPGGQYALTSDALFSLDRFPQQPVVVGSGYIGIEFAGIFAGLGARTRLLYRGDHLLSSFDADVRTFVGQQLQHKGIELLARTQIQAIDRIDQQHYRCQLNDGRSLTTDLILYAIGRRPNTQGLNLSALGIALDAQGAIVVDDQYRTAVASVYAVGDVINRVQLTPVALAQGMAVANGLFARGQSIQTIDYRCIPTAVFCQPNVACVGLTEAQARAEYTDIAVYESQFRPLKHALSGSDERMMIKLIVDRTSERVLGAHMVGADAGEIIQGIAIALKAGLTKAQFDATLGIHPTAAEEFVTLRQARAGC